MGSLKILIATALVFVAAPVAAQAQDFNGSKPLLCSITATLRNARKATAVKKRRLKTSVCHSF